MTLEQVVTTLANTMLDNVNDWYQWRIPGKLPPGVTLCAGNQYAQTVDLKLKLNELWLTSGREDRFALAKYYVEEWGGIHRNSRKKLMGYIDMSECPDPVSEGKHAGIASWSKVLSICAPQKYAIFDARVSTALNCLQIMHKVERTFLFPNNLQSRNGTIKKAQERIKPYRTTPKRIFAKNYYRDYLDLIKKVSLSCNIQPTPIYAIEMLLFAQAEELANKAISHFNQA